MGCWGWYDEIELLRRARPDLADDPNLLPLRPIRKHVELLQAAVDWNAGAALEGALDVDERRGGVVEDVHLEGPHLLEALALQALGLLRGVEDVLLTHAWEGTEDIVLVLPFKSREYLQHLNLLLNEEVAELRKYAVVRPLLANWLLEGGDDLLLLHHWLHDLRHRHVWRSRGRGGLYHERHAWPHARRHLHLHGLAVGGLRTFKEQ